jgi:hypothetical protein
VPLANQQPRFVARSRKSEPVNHAIEAPFKKDKQIFAGYALHPLGFFKIRAELTLEQTISPFDFLFGPQLRPVIGDLDPALSMLSRSVATTLESALIGVTPVTFEE